MELISDSHVPKYAQIADIFRQRIARGVWTQGLRLPANEELAAEFGVSRVTIRQAVDLLARDGVIEAQQGRGTFVTGTRASRTAGSRSRPRLSDLADSVSRHLARDHQHLREPQRCAAASRGRHAGRKVRLHAPRAFAQTSGLLRDLDLSRREDLPQVAKALPQRDRDPDPERSARSRDRQRAPDPDHRHRRSSRRRGCCGCR